jgi:hypothetical protein
MPRGVDLNFAPRDRHHSKLIGEQVHSQIIPPLQFNLTDGLGELASTVLCGISIREGHLAVYRHKKCGTCVEILNPSQWTILSDGTRDGLHKRTHSSVDCDSLVRGQARVRLERESPHLTLALGGEPFGVAQGKRRPPYIKSAFSAKVAPKSSLFHRSRNRSKTANLRSCILSRRPPPKGSPANSLCRGNT